jgi:hypothetical protein
MAEREILLDAINVGFINDLGGAQRTAAVGAFAREEVAFAGARTQDLAFGGNLEPLGNGFACFNSFRASHISTNILKNEREI